MDNETRKKWMASRTKHGAYIGGREAPEHYIWRTMIARCNRPTSSGYRNYGGRGIKVCDRWKDYSLFMKDVGPRPDEDHSLDRIDNDGNYEPGNVRWASRSDQQKNKTTTKFYTDGSFTGTLVECARHLGISKELAHWRWSTWGTFVKGDTSWLLLPKD